MSSHLYIHIPFCRSKCLYCDFYSLPRTEVPWETFLRAVTDEARSRRNELPSPPDTIYVGGGTPSLMPPETATELLHRMSEIFGARPEEITIELNPDNVTPEYAAALLEAGFNRFSMGVQSFDDALLRSIGRRHTAARADEAYESLLPSGNVSIDLMFGLPGQTFDSWQRDVERAIALRPKHISLYSLMLEEGTAMTRLVEAGKIQLPPQECSEEMYLHLCETLAASGYRHYEISNFALPGFESRHNTAYWHSAPYLGLGPGAHSYDGKRLRTANLPDTASYLRGDRPFTTETLTDTELREEYLMTRLRTDRGISLAEYAVLPGGSADTERLRRNLRRQLDAGMIEKTADTRCRIPERHWLTADPIIVSLL